MATKGKGKGKKSDSKKTVSAIAVSLDSIGEQLKAQGINLEDLCASGSGDVQCKVITLNLGSVESC